MLNLNHKKLKAWLLAIQLYKEVLLFVGKLPKEEIFNLPSQIKRASLSISNNIAEGAAKRSKKEFIQFLYIAEGSLSEIDTLLELSVALNFLSVDLSASLFNTLENISKLIFGLIKKLDLQQ